MVVLPGSSVCIVGFVDPGTAVMSPSPSPSGHSQKKTWDGVFCQWPGGKGGRGTTSTLESVRPAVLTSELIRTIVGAVLFPV